MTDYLAYDKIKIIDTKEMCFIKRAILRDTFKLRCHRVTHPLCDTYNFEA